MWLNPQVVSLVGNVVFFNVEKIVKLTDMCVLARHVADMSAGMSTTQPKTVLAKILTMSSQHVAYVYVGNMLAYVGNMLAACNQVDHV